MQLVSKAFVLFFTSAFQILKCGCGNSNADLHKFYLSNISYEYLDLFTLITFKLLIMYSGKGSGS